MPKGQVKSPSPVWRIRASRGTLPTLVFNINGLDNRSTRVKWIHSNMGSLRRPGRTKSPKVDFRKKYPCAHSRPVHLNAIAAPEFISNITITRWVGTRYVEVSLHSVSYSSLIRPGNTLAPACLLSPPRYGSVFLHTYATPSTLFHSFH